MRNRARPLALLAGAVTVAAVAASCAIPLGDLGGPSSIAVSINESGVVVGVSEVPGSTPEHRVERAFRRLPDGTVTELASPPGSAGSAATAINDAGVVAGLARFAGAPPAPDAVHLVQWDADGTVHDLGSLGAADANVTGIDEDGRIVGWADPAGGVGSGFVYDPAVGHVADLPDLPDGLDSVALGMNDVGDVVGYQWLDLDPYPLAVPARWDLDAGTVTDLTPTWGAGLVSAVNDHGSMTGLASFPEPTPMGHRVEAAILRPGEAAPTALGAGTWALPTSINEHEVVVGWHSDATTGSHAYRWAASTGAVRLTDGPGSFAHRVNDRGQIVGQDDSHAALFVPPPPP